MEFYYEVSPPMADYIANHDTLKAMVRWVPLLLVAISWKALRISPGATLALMVLFTVLFIIGCAMLFKQKTMESRNDGMLGRWV